MLTCFTCYPIITNQLIVEQPFYKFCDGVFSAVDFLQWKERLIGALKEIEGGSRAGKAKDLFYKTNGSIQDKDSVEDTKMVCSSFLS